ncbi:NADPH-dependent pterin aldehyde reductase-like [Benincasa hispida]|uniref:NADPH-dependent pterin aldehyde reductase-like n=1 Tax=Benincasa hispida TaxID=102211 RepID=UPI0019016989|nr:NADPH-dependent pterin aldehyde reductase-like [Benincasa hispida]
MATATADESSRKVLITGVSKGLGRALALELANRGHTIIGCSRDQTKLHSLQQQLAQVSSTKHLLFNVDVRSNTNVEEFVQAIVENELVPNIIVNNAGLINRNGKIWELDAQEFDNVIDTNVKGIANIMRHFIPLMISTNKGIIINMSSLSGRDAHGLVLFFFIISNLTTINLLFITFFFLFSFFLVCRFHNMNI